MLRYTYVDGMAEKRGPHRADHLANIKSTEATGKLAVAGAFLNPVDGALFLFKDSTKEEVEEFVKNDQYVKAGLVSKYDVREFGAVVG